MRTALGQAPHNGPQRHLDDLLILCAKGDEIAFASLYDATAKRIYGLSVRVLRDHSQAEETTHDAFLDIWRFASRFDPNKGTATAWCFTIAHRKAVSRVRSSVAARKRDTNYQVLNLEVEFDSTSEQASSNVIAQDVRTALNQLTVIQRQAVELAYFDGLTGTEIAESLGIPLGTAKTRIRDGLTQLRMHWSPQVA